MQLGYYIITGSMNLCFIVAFSCIVLQYKASIYFWDKLSINPYLDITTIEQMRQSTAKQSLLLYGVYVFSVLCTLQCFLCHISNELPSWFCKYGMAVCVVLYCGAKTFLYGYLLERAVLVQHTERPLLPPIVTKKILPTYLLLYFLVYLIVCPIYFHGKLEHDHGTEECKFDEYWPQLFQISSVLDFIHCTGLTILFLAPNCKDIYLSRSKVFNSPQQIKIFVTQMNIHLIAIITCSLSSVIFMLIMSDAHSIVPEYIWFGGNIDMMINCVAAFFTVPQNRAFVVKFICCNWCHLCDCSKIMECNLCCSSLTLCLIMKMEENDEYTSNDSSTFNKSIDENKSNHTQRTKGSMFNLLEMT